MARILVVEDEASVRRLTVRMLSTLGYETLEAKDGIEALELCRNAQDRIDLIVSDMVMPKMDGKAFIEQLKSEDIDFKVLFVSGYSVAETVDGEQLGVEVAFIQKPFSREALGEKVKQLLSA
jgi:CheY-like chemotaxis protein